MNESPAFPNDPGPIRDRGPVPAAQDQGLSNAAALTRSDAGHITVTYTLAPKRSHPVHRVRIPKPRSAPRRPTDRTARMLALAHYIDRLIDGGVIADYAEAAEKLGVS